MRRRLPFLAVALAAFAGFVPAAARASSRPLCDDSAGMCAEVDGGFGSSYYVGHDEPSLLFYSGVPGSGNSSLYRVVLPTDPPTLPTQDATGGTWNFQLHPALWLGMALCDNQSAPEFTHAACAPDSDTNIKDGGDPAQPNYIGYHTGAAFLELQFYPPGWVPFGAGGISCDATHWCAAMAIFSFNRDQNTGVFNNQDCLNKVSAEPVAFAFITRNGVPHAPPDPLSVVSSKSTAFIPSSSTDLFMSSGDSLVVDIHDTPDGLQAVIRDLTTGQSGFMTSSVANGWAQINYDPKGACTESPYAFHPMYATSSEHTRVPWAAHSYNVAFSDEIGHFEYCAVVKNGACSGGGDADADDAFCFGASASLLVQIGGCTDSDIDFDGPPYQSVWPGTLPSPTQDARVHPRSILFSSPVFNGTQNFDRIAFEADLPRIEAADFGGSCNRSTGAGCVNPPPGAAFYPIYSTGSSTDSCLWQFGGTRIKGTTNTFGGTSTAEFGPLLQSVYPGPGLTPILRFNNFRNVLGSNPCPA
jgi:hypothetical protein